MMNLRVVSDQILLNKTESLAQQEREVLTSLLHHLREIERRRLFSTLGFASLFDYVVRKLQYSEDQAYRRIAAMRLLKEIPELEPKISSGSLSLTNLGLAHAHFRREKKLTSRDFTKQEKTAFIEMLENKTAREAEKTVLAASSLGLVERFDQIRQTTDDRVEITFSAPGEIRTKIEQLKALLAHKNPNVSLAELFTMLCDLGLKEWKKSPAAPQKRSVNKISNQAAIRRAVWKRDQAKCTNCGSIYALEIDHRVPKAKGGEDSLGNLRLLCRNCNQRAAIEQFGAQKMDQFLGGRPRERPP